MNSKERFYSTINYKGYDRPPTTHRGTPEVNNELMKKRNNGSRWKYLCISFSSRS